MRPTPRRFVSCVERVAAQSGRGAAHEYVGIPCSKNDGFATVFKESKAATYGSRCDVDGILGHPGCPPEN